MRGWLRSRAARFWFGFGICTLALLTGPAQQALAGVNYAAISGSGSSWSSVALMQWAENLRADGIVINFNPNGSAQGRADYMAQQVDFAASDPPFRNGTDPFDVGGAEHPAVGYSYVPDTAGGTAFMYHLDVGGHLITNLRLSGETIMKIFTGQITNWDDPAITHDYGQQLPSIRIIPVIRSDGSGATYFFTRWMAHMGPADWNAFCTRVSGGRVHAPCGQTEFYPQFTGAVAQNGSDNVATYISASYGQGAIGYDEYAYALNSHYPVVALENPAGYYVLPTASNVAVALTQAQINEDPNSPNFLQQNLDNVYTFKDRRSYPLSSYSYLIVPRLHTKMPANFTPADGQTLSTYINYFLCAGQRYSAELGYSPLPLNLVQGGLLQSGQIPGHVPTPSLAAGCDNPTLKNGKLIVLADAPYPSRCQKAGTPLDCSTTGPAAATSPSPGASSAAGQGGSTTGTGAGSTGTTGAGTAGAGTGDGVTLTGGPVTGAPVNLASSDASPTLLGVLTGAGIVAAVAGPPGIYAVVRRRRPERR
jgi:ABC-type phosphate transport system substrate-binding protein